MSRIVGVRRDCFEVEWNGLAPYTGVFEFACWSQVRYVVASHKSPNLVKGVPSECSSVKLLSLATEILSFAD